MGSTGSLKISLTRGLGFDACFLNRPDCAKALSPNGRGGAGGAGGAATSAGRCRCEVSRGTRLGLCMEAFRTGKSSGIPRP